MVGFLIFETLCLGKSKTLPCIEKKYHKNERHMCKVTPIFTKLALNMCLFSAQIFMIEFPGVTTSYGETLDFIAFFEYFYTLMTSIHVWSIVSSLNFHRLCAWIVWIFWYVNVPNVIASYGKFSNLLCFFIYYCILKRYTVIKLLQIICKG